MIKKFQQFYNESFVPKRIEDRMKDPHGQRIKMQKEVREKMWPILYAFSGGDMELERLRTELLKLNPYDISDERHQWFADWIEENVESYKKGDEYVFSLTSSGSILHGWDDEDIYDQ